MTKQNSQLSNYSYKSSNLSYKPNVEVYNTTVETESNRNKMKRIPSSNHYKINNNYKVNIFFY
jgi:hypothetical protein